jgi:hypothetical protein
MEQRAVMAEERVRHAEPWRIGHFGQVLGPINAHQGAWKETSAYSNDWFKEWA